MYVAALFVAIYLSILTTGRLIRNQYISWEILILAAAITYVIINRGGH